MIENVDEAMLKEAINELAKSLGLEEFEQFSIKGAAGLLFVRGFTNDNHGYVEAIRRLNWDGTPFNPDNMSAGARREWVKKLIIQGSCTQMEAAAFLDCSQTTISNDLKWLHELDEEQGVVRHRTK
jgi:hypothetical protein